MTVDEIKEKHSMHEVVESYGIKINRTGFCCCPFHKEKTPSMKIYDKSFNCYGCGVNGDIFTFVQRIENYTFKEAFYQLGGEYEKKPTRERMMKRAHFLREQEKRKRAEEEARNNQIYIADTITAMRYVIDNFEPLSDIWCLAKNFEPLILHDWEELYITGEQGGDDIYNVLRRCEKFRQDLVTI